MEAKIISLIPQSNENICRRTILYKKIHSIASDNEHTRRLTL